jgi:hypothetical protein
VAVPVAAALAALVIVSLPILAVSKLVSPNDSLSVINFKSLANF